MDMLRRFINCRIIIITYILTYLISYYFVERIVLAPVMHHMYKYVGNKKSLQRAYTLD